VNIDKFNMLNKNEIDIEYNNGKDNKDNKLLLSIGNKDNNNIIIK